MYYGKRVIGSRWKTCKIWANSPFVCFVFYMQSKSLYSLSLAGGVILYMYFSLYMKKLILNLYSSIKILICFDIERNIWKKWLTFGDITLTYKNKKFVHIFFTHAFSETWTYMQFTGDLWTFQRSYRNSLNTGFVL